MDAKLGHDAATLNALLTRQKAAHIREGAPSAEVRIARLDRCINLLIDHRHDIEDALNTDFGSRSREATAFTVDGTREADVVRLFDAAMADDNGSGPADLFVFNMGNNAAVDFREMTAQHFEDSWRVGCFAGFLFGREAMRRLAPLGRGTVIFTGASGSLRERNCASASGFTSSEDATRSSVGAFDASRSKATRAACSSSVFVRA